MQEVPALERLVRIGSGYQAEVYALDERRVVRMALRPDQLEEVRREAAALEAAAQAGAPVPQVFGLVDVDGRPGMVMERLGDENLLFELGRKPWRLGDIARTLGRLHAGLHDVEAPPELPSVHEFARMRLASPRVPAEVRALALSRLDELPEGGQLAHLDFHPANVLPAGDGHKVIDWPNAARGAPEADVARTLVILLAASAPPHAPFVVRRLDPLGRALLRRGYVREYGRHRELDDELVLRWRRVHAAARLAEHRPGERRWLLAEAAPA